jgi:hypothetical protein
MVRTSVVLLAAGLYILVFFLVRQLENVLAFRLATALLGKRTEKKRLSGQSDRV